MPCRILQGFHIPPVSSEAVK
ncbi:hypothetical protein M0802_016612 [Mischocyttarus mexicanus]|nr:hypothetical protein M0802_016612 [Mischocyttarus mexicanus]